MPEPSPFILPTQPEKALDYEFLREEGIRHLQALSGKQWTDYNAHDPGITILEVLCYALTELSYRAGFDIKDILSYDPGSGASQTFFLPPTILTCNPVTLEDYRKILLDFADENKRILRNAWLDKSSTKGLYNVFLEFESTEASDNTNDPGDFNSNIIIRKIEVTNTDGKKEEYTIEITFLSFYEDVNQELNLLKKLQEGSLVVERLFPFPKDSPDVFFAFIKSKASEDTRLKVSVAIYPFAFQENGDDFYKGILNDLLNKEGPNILTQYQLQIQTASKNIEKIKSYLRRFRNLCEDFDQFRVVKLQEIGVKADIEIDRREDPQKIRLGIFEKLFHFLSPQINFYSLDEMLAKGYSIDEIFEGPLLQHGFIDAKEFARLQHREVIYTSDIIQQIMNVKGVIAVRKLSLSNYIKNQPMATGVTSCLRLSNLDISEPRFSRRKSEITLFTNNFSLPVFVSDSSGKKESQKNTFESKNKELLLGRGNIVDLDDFYSIQNNFPAVYGIGEAGLSQFASEERKGQAKQLKGYLLFFDQLLANYLSQLANVKELFSISPDSSDPDKSTTYFSKSLIRLAPGAEKEGILNKTYNNKGENPEAFVKRRNTFLHHLLARFAENFTDYSLALYLKKYGAGESINGDTALDKNTLQEENSRMQNLLQDLPAISSNRARGLSPENKSTGLEEKINKIFGIEEIAVIEHILLHKVNNEIVRQFSSDLPLQLTVVLPKKLNLYPNIPTSELLSDESKEEIERVIKMEIPVHIKPKILWVSDSEFEKVNNLRNELLTLSDAINEQILKDGLSIIFPGNTP